MKRLIIYTLIGLFSLASFPSTSVASRIDNDRDKGKAKNETLKMKPKKVSKQTAKLRQQREKDRQKHMASIKRSNQRNHKK